MAEALTRLRIGAGHHRRLVRPLGVFAAWWLQAYGYTLAAVFAAYFVCSAWLGLRLVSSKGVSRYQDLATAFAAGLLAPQGNTASIYVSADFIKAQVALDWKA